jgi:hypothetical protein
MCVFACVFPCVWVLMGRLLSHTTQCACVGTCTVLRMVSYTALTWRCVAVAPRSKRPPAVVQPVDVTTVLEYNIAENRAARPQALRDPELTFARRAPLDSRRPIRRYLGLGRRYPLPLALCSALRARADLLRIGRFAPVALCARACVCLFVCVWVCARACVCECARVCACVVCVRVRV